jgi:hypothetical protein
MTRDCAAFACASGWLSFDNDGHARMHLLHECVGRGRPAAVMDWGGTSGAFADPDGYVWEVAHNPGWTVNPDGTVRL